MSITPHLRESVACREPNTGELERVGSQYDVVMTEAEWLTSKTPIQMLGGIRATASDRKLRLFAGACCRRIWPLLVLPVPHVLPRAAAQRAVEVAECYADGDVTEVELIAARTEAESYYKTLHSQLT